MISQLACNGVITLNPLGCDGSWVSIPASHFDASLLDPVLMAEAVGAGFIFGFAPLAFVWSGRIFLEILFKK
jgi:hypothetical protein